MKNFTFLCLTVLVSLGTFAAPKYLVQTGKSGDAAWDEAIVTDKDATVVDLTVQNTTLDAWINSTFTDAESGKEVWIAAGTYTIGSGISRSFASIKLYGGFAGTEKWPNNRAKGVSGEPWDMANPTIINADGKQLVAAAYSQNTWDGLTITNSVSGSGVQGGVARIASNAVIRNCRFINNSSPVQGGALHTYNHTNIQVLDCYFEGNIGTQGGAINVNNAAGNTYIIDHCYFKDNEATSTGNAGGAVYFQNPGTYTVNACVFDYNNAAGHGTALFSNGTGDGYTKITNCLFKNQQNSAKYPLYMLQGAVLNCTFASNAGGSVYIGDTGSSIRFENNVVWGADNTECNIRIGDIAGYTMKNNMLGKMINPTNVTKDKNYYLTQGDDRYFEDAANGDFHLSWKAKEMIGKGFDLTADGVTNDLDGKTRTLNDIGCYASSWDIYSRTVYPQQSAYGTLCIPKDVHAGEFEGATFYRIAGTISGRSELAIETVNALEAGHSYIFEIDPEATMIRLNQTGAAAPEPIAENGLYGTYQDISDLGVHLGSLEDIYVVYNGEIRLAGTNLKVPAKRAWIKMSEVCDALTEPQAQGSVRKRIPNASWQQGGATPLEQTMQTTGEEEIYDLLGRRVSSPVAGGIYIVNGQKVIIK